MVNGTSDCLGYPIKNGTCDPGGCLENRKSQRNIEKEIKKYGFIPERFKFNYSGFTRYQGGLVKIFDKIRENAQKPGLINRSAKDFMVDSDLINKLKKEWNKKTFLVGADKKHPKISLDIHTHKELGISITFNSLPWKEAYNFSTGKPVNEKQALNLVKEYCVKQGIEYAGK